MALVYLDPGHGGHDPGGVGNGLREKDLVLKIARYTRDYLKANYRDVEVRTTRDSDTFVSLSRRAQMANNANADAFVSIHTNAGNSSAIGYEDFIFNGSSVSSKTKQLQNAMHNELYRHFTVNRGKKRANFAVLRLTKMSAILTESGFVSNSRDANFLKKESNLKKLGESHAKGIAVFLGLEKGSSSSSSSNSSSSSSSSTASSTASTSSSGVQWVGTNDKGKTLEVIAPTVNFYNSPQWTNPYGKSVKGDKWIVDNLYRVNGSLQYRVQNSRGDLYYITAREDLVRVVGGTGSSSLNSSSGSQNVTSYKGNSIVDYLNLPGNSHLGGSSMKNRRRLAKQHGISSYSGTENQNLRLLNALRNGEGRTVQEMADDVLSTDITGNKKRADYLGLTLSEYEPVRQEINKRYS